MDKDTFLSKITEIGTETDDVKRRSLLTEISDSVSSMYDNESTLNTTIDSLNASLTKANESLQKAQETNMQLFLRVNAQKSEQGVSDDLTGVEKEPERLSYEDLFKESK